jgi:hypothetical protein
MNYLWVVEVAWGGEWRSTLHVGYTRRDGRYKLRKCRSDGISFKYRLVKYTRAK